MIRLTRYPICVYCGIRVPTRSAKKPVTCACHRDLPKLDPYFAELDQWSAA